MLTFDMEFHQQEQQFAVLRIPSCAAEQKKCHEIRIGLYRRHKVSQVSQ